MDAVRADQMDACALDSFCSIDAFIAFVCLFEHAFVADVFGLFGQTVTPVERN
mgnify:CR=1 FL=1